MSGALRIFHPWFATIGVCTVILLVMSGCSWTDDVEHQYPTTRPGQRGYDDEDATLFGPGGLMLLDTSRAATPGGGGYGLAVNSFLWRASLDTIGFMPLNSTDPFGGVIITDWYAPPETPSERFKINVFILDQSLRADGLRASVFKQRKVGSAWRDLPLDKSLNTQLENTILTRARQLRIASNTE